MVMRAQWHPALGRPGEARRRYQPGDAVAGVPGIRYLITCITCAGLAELAAAFGDQQAADEIHRSPLPYADLFTCTGAGLTTVDGSARRYPGITAPVPGRPDDAIRHPRAAVAASEHEGLAARAALATAGLARAPVLPGPARRDRAGDPGRPPPRPSRQPPPGSSQACPRSSATSAA